MKILFYRHQEVQIRGGGEGGRGAVIKTLRKEGEQSQLGLNIRRGSHPQAPPLDPPLITMQTWSDRPSWA